MPVSSGSLRDSETIVTSRWLVPCGDILYAARLVMPRIAKNPFHLGTFNIFLLINSFSSKSFTLLFSHMIPSSCNIGRCVIEET